MTVEMIADIYRVGYGEDTVISSGVWKKLFKSLILN